MRAPVAIIAALSLAACATTPSSQVNEGKAIADAWSAFGAAASTLDGLAKAGVLTASEKVTIATDGAKIRDALNAATVAVDNNDNATASQNVATVTSLMVDLTAIVTAHAASK